MRVCLGGTFEPLHAGHRALLATAAQDATALFVGITEGRLAQRRRPVAPWQARAMAVTEVLRGLGYQGELTVRALADPAGPAARGPFDRIVVSPESEAGALQINAERARTGLPPLEVVVVPHVLGQDLLPISGTAIAEGRIDDQGARLRPVLIALGSRNPVKTAAVRGEVGRLLGAAVDVRATDVSTSVPEQPVGAQTWEGARARARAALAAVPEADYAVGIEAGLIQFPGDAEHLDAQACVVIDRSGWQTHGWGPAFGYPRFVTRRALAGEMVSTIFGPIAADPAIGGTTGAIGYLSRGAMDRTELTRIAVLMAFLPRLRRDLYRGPHA